MNASDAKTLDVMAYLCRNYPHPYELSKARLTKLVYLADWRASIARGQQVTSIEWYFHQFGPYVDDIKDLAEGSPYFKLTSGSTMMGSTKETISWIGPDLEYLSLSSDETKILEHVIKVTEGLNFQDFIKLVYSTYPVLSQPRHSVLDLPKLAAEYNASKTLASA